MSPPPTSFSVQAPPRLGGTGQKAIIVRVFLVPHVTKLLPGSRSVHVCVCVSFGPDFELVTPQYWFATLMLTICLACSSHCQTKRSSSSKHDLELLFWFCGQKTLLVHLSTAKSWIKWEAVEKLLQFFSMLRIQLWPWILQTLCHRSCLWAWGGRIGIAWDSDC